MSDFYGYQIYSSSRLPRDLVEDVVHQLLSNEGFEGFVVHDSVILMIVFQSGGVFDS